MNSRESDYINTGQVIQQPHCNGYVRMGPIEGCLGDFSTLHLILILGTSGLIIAIWKSPSIIKEMKWYKFRQKYYDFCSVMEKKFYRKK